MKKTTLALIFTVLASNAVLATAHAEGPEHSPMPPRHPVVHHPIVHHPVHRPVHQVYHRPAPVRHEPVRHEPINRG